MFSNKYCNSKVTRQVPLYGLWRKEKHWYKVCDTMFIIDTKYIPMKQIASGECGVVCSAITKHTYDIVAIKKMSDVFRNKTNALRTLRELKLLRQIKHKNVIGVKDVMIPTEFSTFDEVYVVYEAMETNLYQIIHSPVMRLTNDQCKKVIFQLLRGLKHLHSANIIHRDLDPGKLQVNADCSELKICYFGLGGSNNRQLIMSDQHGVTRWYRAPEQLLLCGATYETSSIDMWSVGCILAEILGRKPLFRGTDFSNQLMLILSVLGSQKEDDLEFVSSAIVKSIIRSKNTSGRIPFSSIFPHADPLALDLLSKMLVFDPSKRITTTEALSHPYISSLNDSSDESPEAELHIDIDIDESTEESSLRSLVLTEIFLHHS